MIGSVSEGKGFKGCLKYLLEKEKGELIGGNMIGQTPQELAKEFKLSRQLNPTIQRPVFHVSLSLVNRPDYRESLSDSNWNEVAQKYLERMGFGDNQYVVVRHHDSEHDHIHMVASRGRLDGKAVNVWQSKRRTEKILRELETEYNLMPVQCSWEVERRSQAEGQYQKQRTLTEVGHQEETDLTRTIQQRIDRALEGCKAVSELTERLKLVGVETRLRSQRDGSINGISYHCAELSVTGYKLGRGYTWAAISSRLERNQFHQQVKEAAQLEAQRQQTADTARLEAQRLGLERQRLLEQQKLKEEVAQELIKAEARQLKASEALELKRMVDSYFQAAPPNCSDSELTTATDLADYWSQKVGQVYGEVETLTEEINAANFWQRLQPQHKRGMSKLNSLTAESKQADAQMKEADKRNEELQLVRQRYREWEQSPQTQKMRQSQSYLLTPQGQELVALGVEQERQQQMERTREQERKRQMEHTLYKLQQWYKAAQSLNRSPSYLNRIVEVTQEFTTGTPIPDKALAAMIVDLKEQLEHRQSEEIKQQRNSRDWDLSR